MDILCPFQSRQLVSCSGMDTIFASKSQQLLEAARKGNEPLVQRLLEKNSTSTPRLVLKSRDEKYGRTPLHWACLEGHFTVVQLLLKYQGVTYFNETMNAVDKEGFTALTLAAFGGHLPVAHVLLENGAHVEGGKKSGQTPLHMACIQGHQEVVQYLIEKGANIQAINRFGYTALDLASHYNRLGVTHTLLTQGADPNAKHFQSGYTSLHWACQLGHFDIARALTDMNANVNAKNAQGSTPLHCACYGKDANVALVKYLVLDKGADPTIQNCSGKTCLDLAVSDWEEVEEATYSFSTPVEVACCANEDFMEFLLLSEEADDDTNAVKNKKKFVDLPAVYREHGRVAQFLTDFLCAETESSFLRAGATPVSPQSGTFVEMRPFDEESKETAEMIRFITPEAERAWIAQKEALAIQKDRENRLTVLAQLKANKTSEIQQALDVAKAMCPEGNPSNRFWLRVLSLQEENKAIDKSINELMAAPRPTSEKVSEYLVSEGHVTPDESVHEEMINEIPSATTIETNSDVQSETVPENATTEPHSSLEPDFVEDPMNVTLDHSSQEDSMDDVGISEDHRDFSSRRAVFEHAENNLFLKTPATAE